MGSLGLSGPLQVFHVWHNSDGKKHILVTSSSLSILCFDLALSQGSLKCELSTSVDVHALTGTDPKLVREYLLDVFLFLPASFLFTSESIQYFLCAFLSAFQTETELARIVVVDESQLLLIVVSTCSERLCYLMPLKMNCSDSEACLVFQRSR